MVNSKQKVDAPMQTPCEVIGWLLDDSDKTQVLVREKNGHISLQTADPESAFGQYAIQTGSFRCGAPIIDPVTRETVGYEMVRAPGRVAALA